MTCNLTAIENNALAAAREQSETERIAAEAPRSDGSRTIGMRIVLARRIKSNLQQLQDLEEALSSIEDLDEYIQDPKLLAALQNIKDDSLSKSFEMEILGDALTLLFTAPAGEVLKSLFDLRYLLCYDETPWPCFGALKTGKREEAGNANKLG